MLIVATFITLLLLGLPILYVIGLTSLLYLVISGLPLIALAQRMFVGMDSFVLMAIPFYILMGNIMLAGGVTDRLVRWCKLIVGHIPGGLGHVNVLVSTIFAGISGSASADTAAIGGILIPAMTREGYDPEFATSVTVASSCISPIIPPSIVFVVYAVAAEVSIGAMFLGGVLPGLLMAATQMAVVWYYALKRNYPRGGRRATVKEIARGTVEAMWVLLGPGIILFGILTGVFTPTEAGAVAAVYALIVAFCYRKLKLRDLPGILVATAVTTAGAFLLVAMASSFAWILTIEQVPQTAARAILSITDNPVLILLLINALLLFVGTFMEAVSALIILVPILLPITAAAGISPIHLGVVMCVNLVIGFITPPVGTCLFIGSSIARISIERLSRAVIPFFGACLVSLLTITLWPALVLWLPRLVMGR